MPHGTGSMVIDPHGYANVLGLDGIRYVLESSKNCRSIFSSCCRPAFRPRRWKLPVARFTADDLALMIADDRIAGIGRIDELSRAFFWERKRSWQRSSRERKSDRRSCARIDAAKILTPTRWRASAPITRSAEWMKPGKNCALACISYSRRQHRTKPRTHHRPGHTAEFRQLLICD